MEPANLYVRMLIYFLYLNMYLWNIYLKTPFFFYAKDDIHAYIFSVFCSMKPLGASF